MKVLLADCIEPVDCLVDIEPAELAVAQFVAAEPIAEAALAAAQTVALPSFAVQKFLRQQLKLLPEALHYLIDYLLIR